MRIFWLASSMCGAISIAAAQPSNELSPEKINALGELFSGYSSGLICNKRLNLDVASKFLKLKLGADSLSIDELVKVVQMPTPIHLMEMGQLMKGKAPDQLKKVVAEHCKTAATSFGPNGSVVPGLLE